MCGIVAVLGSPHGVDPPSPEALLLSLAEAVAALPDPSSSQDAWAGSLLGVATALEELDQPLRCVGGVRLLVGSEELCSRMRAHLDEAADLTGRLETDLDRGGEEVATVAVEEINAALVEVRDVLWSLSKDRLGHADRVRQLAGGDDDAAFRIAVGCCGARIGQIARPALQFVFRIRGETRPHC